MMLCTNRTFDDQ